MILAVTINSLGMHKQIPDVKDRIYHPDGTVEILYTNGLRRFMLNGRPHRIGAPAITAPNGKFQYWQYGSRHRDDVGPTFYNPEGINGSGQYNVMFHWEDRPLSFNDYCKLPHVTDEDRLAMILRYQIGDPDIY